MGAGKKRVRADWGHVHVSLCESGGAWPSAETRCALEPGGPGLRAGAAAASVVSTMGGQHLPEVESVPGCLVGLRAGTGTFTSATEQLGGPGLAEVPSLSPVPLPSRWCNWIANATTALPLIPPPQVLQDTFLPLQHFF